MAPLLGDFCLISAIIDVFPCFSALLKSRVERGSEVVISGKMATSFILFNTISESMFFEEQDTNCLSASPSTTACFAMEYPSCRVFAFFAIKMAMALFAKTRSKCLLLHSLFRMVFVIWMLKAEFPPFISENVAFLIPKSFGEIVYELI